MKKFLLGLGIASQYPINIPLSVKDWMYGYGAPVVQSTDTYNSGTDPNASFTNMANLFEYLSFKNNVKATVFTSFLYQDDAYGEPAFETGRIIPSIYFQTDRWYIGGDINDISNYPLIPDYYETAWTAAGVAAFSGAVLGEAKADRYPNHGEDLYAISGGVYGWDANGNLGSNNNIEFITITEYSKTRVVEYANAQQHSSSLRNSQAGCIVGAQQQYIVTRGGGLDAPDRGYFTSPAGRSYENGNLLGTPQNDLERDWYTAGRNSTRFADCLDIYDISAEDYKDVCDGYFQTSLKVTTGLYADFTHWHSTDVSVANIFMDMIGAWDGDGGFRIWYATWEEAAGYMYYRDAVQSVDSYISGSRIIIEVTKIDKYNTVPFPNTSVDTSLSVEIDLSGTYLAGKSINTNNGKALSLGNDRYIVQVPYGVGMNTTTSVEVYEGPNGYLDLDKPNIITTTVAGGDVEVVSDKPVRIALFIDNGDNYNCWWRSNTLSLVHLIPVSEVSKGVGHVGAITEEGQSVIEDL